MSATYPSDLTDASESACRVPPAARLLWLQVRWRMLGTSQHGADPGLQHSQLRPLNPPEACRRGRGDRTFGWDVVLWARRDLKHRGYSYLPCAIDLLRAAMGN